MEGLKASTDTQAKRKEKLRRENKQTETLSSLRNTQAASTNHNKRWIYRPHLYTNRRHLDLTLLHVVIPVLRTQFKKTDPK